MNSILLIEDNEPIAKGLKYSLEQENFIVTISNKVQKSKELLKVNKYDLIILDITLPDGNGYELCKYIKTNFDIAIHMIESGEAEKVIIDAENW